MKRHTETRLLPYDPAGLFEIVADVGRYPEFLPWCTQARLRPQSDGLVFDADLIISFMAFREKFTSRVTKDPKNLVISVDYLDGPFHKLQNHWRFEPHEKGTNVHFFVEFEFKSRLLEAVIGRVFDQAMRMIVTAFEQRARQILGPIPLKK